MLFLLDRTGCGRCPNAGGRGISGAMVSCGSDFLSAGRSLPNAPSAPPDHAGDEPCQVRRIRRSILGLAGVIQGPFFRMYPGGSKRPVGNAFMCSAGTGLPISAAPESLRRAVVGDGPCPFRQQRRTICISSGAFRGTARS